ncbi:MAG: DUF3365 domain-containing protein [Gammaproteobacteria bacterium]
MSNKILKVTLLVFFALVATGCSEGPRDRDEAADFDHSAMRSSISVPDNAAIEPSLPSTLEEYRNYGQQLAMQTQMELGSNLKRALQEGDAPGAVGFCNIRAEAIANEMSLKLGAKISRASDRPRNPNNQASPAELEVLDQFRSSLKAGEKPIPSVTEQANSMIGYYPILTNGMCLQCHGSPDRDIATTTLSVIRAAYPHDQATGYRAEQLRGMFVVRMKKADGRTEAQ